MLLTVRPGTKDLDLDDSTRVERVEREADYRHSIVAYIPAKREKYMKKHKSSTLLVSTLQAIRKSFQSKIPGFKGDDLRLYLVPTMYDVYEGRQGAGVRISITDVNNTERVITSMKISDKRRSGLQFLQLDPTTIAIHMDVKPVEIPAFGRYTVSVKNRTLMKKPKTFYEVYDFSNVDKIRMALREGHTKRVVMKIPCYSPSSAVSIGNLRLPSTEIQLLVEVQSPKRFGEEMTCVLVGARVICSAHTDAHSALYTQNVHLEDNPAYDVSRAARLTAEVDRGIKDRPSSSAASAHSGVTDTIQSVLSQFLAKANGGSAPSFSWSVSHHDQVVFSHRGLDRRNIGHVGEVLFGVAALRAANGVSPSAWSDMNLLTQHGLEKLLIKAEKKQILVALQELYRPHGRIPSVLELLTHTSGLPQLGSIDAEFDLETLMQVLPGSDQSAQLAKLKEDSAARLAHVLRERVHLIAPPGSLVHFSPLGIAVLSHCFPNLQSATRNLFSELGMDATRIIDGQDSIKGPDDSVHRVTNCTYSTTNDLARFIACIEKANQDPSAHPYLAHSMVPCYRIADHGRNGLHSICNGGMENVTIRLALKDCASTKKADKVSLNAFFKFGERAGEGTTVLCWIPGLHTGLALHVELPMHRLFNMSHKDVGYGRGRLNKAFKPKHLIKMLVQKVSSALTAERGACFSLDQEADYAYSITPKIPPRYSEYTARCANTTDHPEGEIKRLVESSELFQKGVDFYPLFQARTEIRNAISSQPASMRVDDDSVFASMKGIRILKKKIKLASGVKEIYLLEDRNTKEAVQLVFDKDAELRVGVSAAKSLNIHRGMFRKVSVHHSGDVAEHVAIHVVQLGPDQKIVGLHHRGCLYVSKLALLDMKRDAESHRMAAERRRIEGQRMSVNSKYFLWNMTDSIGASMHEKQKPIEAGFGAGLVAGGALGLATGAVAGAALASRPVYYAPPAYPYYYPPGYWRRRRPVYAYPAPGPVVYY